MRSVSRRRALGHGAVVVDSGMVGPLSTVAALTALGPVDGTTGVLRLGTGADAVDTTLVYNSARAKWVSLEHVAFRMTDNRGPIAGYYAGSALGWSTTTGLGTGGWSSGSTPRRIADLMNAGLTVEYRLHAYLRPDAGGTGQNISVFWNLYQVSPGDQKISILTKPPATGWAQTATITGGMGASILGGYYQYEAVDWATLTAPGGGTLATPTKQAIYSLVVGEPVNNGQSANGQGSPIDALLALRFVG